MADTNGHADGRVVRVIGPVVDVEFPPNQLPEINNALKIDITMGDATTTITCEVAQHIGDSSIRAIALKPTDGGTLVHFEERGFQLAGSTSQVRASLRALAQGWTVELDELVAYAESRAA